MLRRTRLSRFLISPGAGYLPQIPYKDEDPERAGSLVPRVPRSARASASSGVSKYLRFNSRSSGRFGTFRNIAGLEAPPRDRLGYRVFPVGSKCLGALAFGPWQSDLYPQLAHSVACIHTFMATPALGQRKHDRRRFRLLLRSGT